MELNKHKVVGSICVISGGLIQLSDDQYSLRSHNLLKLEGDVYEVINRIEFKRGEIFGHDGDLSKVPCVESVGVVSDNIDSDAAQGADESDDQGEPDADSVSFVVNTGIASDYSDLKGKALAGELSARNITPPRNMSAEDKRGLLIDSDAAQGAD